jgi:flagellar biosynthesis protein FlhF
MTESATTTKNSTPPGIERGRKYRFVVSSAEEAISTLRERLGTDAQVISVKQVDGEGLSRFLSSPKLEIIATLPEIPAAPAATAAPEAAAPAPRQAKSTAGRRREETPAPAAPAEDPARKELEEELEAPASGPAPARLGTAQGYAKPGSARQRQPTNVWSVMRSAGFDDALIGSLHYESDPRGVKIEELPLPRALAEVNRRLRLEYQALDIVPATESIAFFGTPGVGKTTALCKRIASDVFINRRSVEVLKLDSDTPNPDDALTLFCDVLGVPMMRDGQDSTSGEADVLYVDLPGLPMSEKGQWKALRGRLDSLKVKTRVLVVNSMYESSLIGASFDLAEDMGATHLVLTHMDELDQRGKALALCPSQRPVPPLCQPRPECDKRLQRGRPAPSDRENISKQHL